MQEDINNRRYYLDSKVLHLRGNIDNCLFKTAFNDLLKNYVKQVVPSTTIIGAHNFLCEKCDVNFKSRTIDQCDINFKSRTLEDCDIWFHSALIENKE